MARLLSCLQFLYCSPSVSAADSLNDLSTFGESWSWGVCTLVHLIGQRRKFELLDLGLHVMRLDAMAPIDRERLEALVANKKSKMTDNDRMEIMILEFLSAVRTIKMRNDAIFDGLESYLPPQAPVRYTVAPADEASVAGPSAPIGAIQAGAGAVQRMSLVGGQGTSLVPPPAGTGHRASVSQPPPTFAAPPPAAPAPPAAGPPPPVAPPAPPAVKNHKHHRCYGGGGEDFKFASRHVDSFGRFIPFSFSLFFSRPLLVLRYRRQWLLLLLLHHRVRHQHQW